MEHRKLVAWHYVSKAFGATVVLGSEDKVQVAKSLKQIVLLINYRNDDFVEATLNYTSSRGVDMVVDDRW